MDIKLPGLGNIPYPHTIIPSAPTKPIDDAIDMGQKAVNDVKEMGKNVLDGGVNIIKSVVDGGAKVVDGVINGAQTMVSDGWRNTKQFIEKAKPPIA